MRSFYTRTNSFQRGEGKLRGHSEYERTEYAYNRQGQAISMTDPNGTVHEYDYDQLGRQVQDRVTTLAAGLDGTVRRISRTYVPRGKLGQVTSYDDAEVGSGTVLNEVAFKYDGFGNMIEDAQAHAGAVDGSTPKVGYLYNDGTYNSARLLQTTYPNGRVCYRTYGDPDSIDNYLSRVRLLGDGVVGTLAVYSFMGAARYVLATYDTLAVSLSYLRQSGQPDGDAGDQYTGYDRFGRTVDMRWQKDATGNVLDQFQYGFDASGNRQWKQVVGVPDPAANGQDEHYGYDRLYQVTQFQRGNLNLSLTAIGGVPEQAEAFDYDPTGNWMRYQTKAGMDPAMEQTRVNNQDNQIVQIDGSSADLAYDKAGNATLIPPPLEGEFAYVPRVLVWDAWNRLVRIALPDGGGDIAVYGYDGLTRRITSSYHSSDYYYNDQWRPVEERRYAAATPYTQYVWGNRYRDDLMLRQRDTDGSGTLDETLWVTHDYYSPTALLYLDGGAGAVVNERFGYSAFGIRRVMNPYYETIEGSAYDWDFAFQGQFRDQESGFYNYGYRYYVPQLGRWLSRDPIGEKGGVNLYAMINNDPLNGVDHLGLYARIKCPNPNTILIELLIEIYPDGGSWSAIGVTDPGNLADRIKTSIEKEWNTSGGWSVPPSCMLSITTSVNARLTQSGEADNSIKITRSPQNASRDNVSMGGQTNSASGEWNPGSNDWVYAHEAGHLMNMADQYQETTPGVTTPNPGYTGEMMGDFSGKVTTKTIGDLVRELGIKCPCECNSGPPPESVSFVEKVLMWLLN